MIPNPSERGSILIEVLVALAVVTIILGAVYQAVGQSALQSRAAEAKRRALMVAESQIAAVGSVIPAQPGRTRGLSSDLAWQVDIAPLPAATSSAGRLLNVTVRVTPPQSERAAIILRTVMLEPRA